MKINFNKYFLFIGVSPCTFLQRARRVVEAWGWKGGVSGKNFRPRKCIYGKFKIGLKHRFPKPQNQPHPLPLHSHSHSHTCMSFCTHKYGKSFGPLPDNGLIFNLLMYFEIFYGDMHGEHCLYLLFPTRSL